MQGKLTLIWGRADDIDYYKYNLISHDGTQCAKPVILSITEYLDINDYVLDGNEIHQFKNPQGLYFVDGLKKIQILPEDIKPSILKDIQNGKIKDGDIIDI